MTQSSVSANNHRQSRSVSMIFATTLLLAGCGGGGSGSDDSVSETTGACAGFDCGSMLKNLSDNVMIPTMEQFQSESAAFKVAVGAWQAEPSNAELKAAAQTAWNDTILAWQSVEVMQTGPLTDNSSFLRDSIYSWPSTSTCVVDQEVIEAETQTDYDITSRTPLRKGLDALEYVLYTPTLDHSCPASTSSTENWNSRPDSEKLSARASYALAAAGDVQRLADELVRRWATASDSFRNELLQTGTAGSRFGSDQEAVNAISDALFYVEKQVKDIKLAEPLGLKNNKCTQGEPACAEAVENRLSGRSAEHIRQNLVAFRQIFLGNGPDGNEGPGFDDLIDSASGENVSAAMEADINEALAAVGQLDQSLKDAVTDPDGVNMAKGIHESTKKITDRLKNDFLAVLGLSIPAAAAGDGD